MKRSYTNLQKVRTKYQQKRKRNSWIKRKKTNKLLRKLRFEQQKAFNERVFINHIAPLNCSFIDNTNEILTYFNEIKEFIAQGQSVELDISKITHLTPDMITLLLVIFNEKQSRKVGMKGNAPNNAELKKMFLSSGFYDNVISAGTKKVAYNNKLWRGTTNNQVQGKMASEALDMCREVFLKKNIKYDTDPLYNLLSEAMSNTKNHANSKQLNTNWWLYWYFDEAEEKLKYSFIDLGIGIFKSANFSWYRETFNEIFSVGNILLVKSFLNGKITSSREKDKAISGKGVKQILSCAKLPEITTFIIITNDIKIDVKIQKGTELSSNFEGTFIYFEVSFNQKNKDLVADAH